MKQILCFFLLLSSIGFSNEIFQGTLKNGMRYYCLPRSELEYSTIKIIVKKPRELCRGPQIDLFFEDEAPQNAYGVRISRNAFDHLVYTYQEDLTPGSLTDILSLMSQHLLNKKPFPDFVLEELKLDYEENKKDPMPMAIQKLFETLWNGDFEYVDRLFTQDNSTINQAYHGLFEPARMAIIIESPFNEVDVKKILENTVEKIDGDRGFPYSLSFKPEKPVAFSVEEKDGPDEDGDSTSEQVHVGYFYYYPVAPNYRAHVLNHLYLCNKLSYEDFCICDYAISELQSVIYLFSLKQITDSYMDQFDFNTTKTELKKYYKNSYTSDVDACLYHFVSAIPETLKLDNQNLLSELETITFDEYCAFIKEQFQHIPIIGIVDIDIIFE